MSRTTKHLAYLVSVPITVVAAVSLAADIENSTVASITGSSIGQSITGSSIGQSITGSSIGQSITGSSIGQSITGSSIGFSQPNSVVVIGQISGIDALAGTINLGDVLVYLGSADAYGAATLGSMVLVSGIQSGVGSLVVADTVTELSSSGDIDEDGIANLMSITGSSVSSGTFR